jgi:hypothetical protein
MYGGYFMNEKFVSIEKELVEKYRVIINTNSTCWSRTHAHCNGTRIICKYQYSNSIISLFTLAHEIGHIMTKTSKMRRCESEYYATVWAIQELHKYGLKVPEQKIQEYQRYVYRELSRGLRRGGTGYLTKAEMNLDNALDITLKLKGIPSKKRFEELKQNFLINGTSKKSRGKRVEL